MTLYCGIDLHANNSVISVIDDHDAVVYEKRHANNLGQIRDVLESFRDDLFACVVESELGMAQSPVVLIAAATATQVLSVN